jgi:holo-[acyl-carrier protein] synthase
MLRTGVDLIEIARIRNAIERHGEHFLQRVYTPNELSHCRGQIPSLAVRFAAKEAVAKALGTGIWRANVTWTDIEVTRQPETGAPLLSLYGAALSCATHLALSQWSVSLSHDRDRAIAFAVAMGNK